jgi:hypothetical protein
METYGSETLRLSHFLDNWLTDDGAAVNLRRRPLFTPINIPSARLFKKLSRTKSNNAAGKMNKNANLIGELHKMLCGRRSGEHGEVNIFDCTGT